MSVLAGYELVRAAEKELRGWKHPMRSVNPEWLLGLGRRQLALELAYPNPPDVAVGEVPSQSSVAVGGSVPKEET